MLFRITQLILLTTILANCSTGPEYERSNPYDLNPAEIDSANLKQFPPSITNKYVFSAAGLKLNIYQTVGPGITEVFRKNGNSDLIKIGEFKYSETSSDFFLDDEIRTTEDIGFPLIYKLSNRYNYVSRYEYIRVDFGEIEKLNISNDENLIFISWEDEIHLNEGFDIYKKQNNHISLYEEVISPDTSFTIPINDENLNSEFLISPYKTFNDEKTFLDTTLYKTLPIAPTNFRLNISNSRRFSLIWDDNSTFETGYKLVNNKTSEEYIFPANQDSFVIEKSLSPLENLSFTVSALLNEKESTKVVLDTTILDYPYPKILDIEHTGERSFIIYFDDPVDFERLIRFRNSVENDPFIVRGSTGFVEITTDRDYNSRPNVYEAPEISFKADLSYGRYGSRSIPISKRPALEILHVHSLTSNTNPKNIDIRTIGNLLVYSKENEIYKVDLNDQELEENQVVTLSDHIKLLRMSNDNSTAIASTDNGSYLIDLVNKTSTHLKNIPSTVHDASFIEDDTKIAVSSQFGLVVYSIDSDSYSYVEGFDSKADLEFIGDASQTRLIGFDRDNQQLNFFNTLFGFEYHKSSSIDGFTINGAKSEITNLSHLNADNNIVGYEIGGAMEFSTISCTSEDNVCEFGAYGPYERDRNGYFQILDKKLRLASTEHHLRVIHKQNLANIHVIERDRAQVSLFKVNLDANIAIEYHDDTSELFFYDISRKWRFTNYGSYDDIVWPSN
ncbi:hypothetical protein [Gracilimonas sp.]|uniref:hypothetical protein n=1 Tax=Gracilimonas sp. TaxID=1974203 RepID=UPI003D0F35D6